IVGWFLLRPLIVSGWIMGAASLRGDFHFWDGLMAGFRSLETLPAGLFTGTHLWFLYYLAVITGAALLLRTAVTATGLNRIIPIADRVAAWLAESRLGLIPLAVATAGALHFMR